MFSGRSPKDLRTRVSASVTITETTRSAQSPLVLARAKSGGAYSVRSASAERTRYAQPTRMTGRHLPPVDHDATP